MSIVKRDRVSVAVLTISTLLTVSTSDPTDGTSLVVFSAVVVSVPAASS